MNRAIPKHIVAEQKRLGQELWENVEKQHMANVLRIQGMMIKLEDELIEAKRALEKHRGAKKS